MHIFIFFRRVEIEEKPQLPYAVDVICVSQYIFARHSYYIKHRIIHFIYNSTMIVGTIQKQSKKDKEVEKKRSSRRRRSEKSNHPTTTK